LPRQLLSFFLCVSPLWLAGCGAAASGLGQTAAEAQHAVGEAVGALAARFGPVEREPAFDALRPKLQRASLVPSRVFDDPEVWTSRDGETRGVSFAGAFADGRYRVGVRPRPRPPLRPGDYTGALALRRLGPGEFEWSAAEAIALGTLPVDGVAGAATALLRGAETAPAGDARGLLRRLLPRTATALGRGLRLAELQLARDGEGATRVSAVALLDPDTLATAFPRYAAFLRRHALPIRLHAEASDGRGGRFWELIGEDGRWALAARVRDGHLVPLGGGLRPVPDALRLRLDLTSKAGLFRYGVAGLEAHVRLLRRPGEKGFLASFTDEPGWVMPFLVKPLLRASLRRPFEGDGAELGYSLREDEAGRTLVTRDYRIVVQESWLVRWIGRNTGAVVAAFRGSAESEGDRFSAEALLALRADLIALAGGGRGLE